MHDPLAVYLHDHLAGATFAIELLQVLRDRRPAESLGRFADELLIEVEKDKAVLEQLAEQFEGGTSAFKEAASWFSEKISRLKLRHQTGAALGTFEALETLALGIKGKEALWTILSHIRAQDVRLQGLDYSTLLSRARTQHAQTEAQRIEAAHTAFSQAKK